MSDSSSRSTDCLDDDKSSRYKIIPMIQHTHAVTTGAARGVLVRDVPLKSSETQRACWESGRRRDITND